MSDLEEAAQRLEEAVARLETAARKGGERKPGAKASADANDTIALVAARLDETISRIDRLLES